jgi:pimeloyl-ACP methyl ester carboxylesterase
LPGAIPKLADVKTVQGIPKRLATSTPDELILVPRPADGSMIGIRFALSDIDMPISMRDMVVVLPGITGSMLQKNGKDVWALTGQALSRFLRTRGRELRELRIASNDDFTADDLDDGIRATAIMPDAHIVPGLWKVDGYGTLTHFLRQEFAFEQGRNYFELPYDWRRDNRVAARKLEHLIAAKLPAWRDFSGNHHAKVILVAHSMGGLISRYYLEIAEGWKNCRALITFGTPYRGSVKSLNFLANGHSVAGVALTEILRSCTSVYQLLPTYEVVQVDGGETVHVTDLKDMSGLDPARAAEARAFHQKMNDAIEAHQKLEAYRRDLTVWPIVGTDQPTLQSATLSQGKLTVSKNLPAGVNPLLGFGDGTVPMASAIPLEMSKAFTMPFHAEVHGSLQNNRQVLRSLREWLRQSQLEGLENLKTVAADQKAVDERPEIRLSIEERPAIQLSVEDQYWEGEPVRIEAQVRASGEPDRVLATIYPIGRQADPIEKTFQRDGDRWLMECERMEEGCYRVRVRCAGENLEAPPPPVADIFSVSSSVLDA